MTDAIDKRDAKFDNNRLNRRVTSNYIIEKEDKDDINDENNKKLFVFPNSSLNNEDNNKDFKQK